MASGRPGEGDVNVVHRFVDRRAGNPYSRTKRSVTLALMQARTGRTGSSPVAA